MENMVLTDGNRFPKKWEILMNLNLMKIYMLILIRVLGKITGVRI